MGGMDKVRKDELEKLRRMAPSRSSLSFDLCRDNVQTFLVAEMGRTFLRLS